MELTIRNARLADASDRTIDIAVDDGRIVELRPNATSGEREFDVDGRLVVPGFVETHIHLDKSCILDRCSSKGGALEEAIAEVSRLKAGFTVDDVAKRARRTLRKCIVNGTTRMRTHVEVDPTVGLRGFEGVKQATREFAWAIDVEICVFPQEGLLNNPGTEELMTHALGNGAGSVGAAPYTDGDPHGQIDRVFEMAREFNVDIDMHLDLAADPTHLDAEYVCRKTDEYGWGGRVAIGHATKFAALAPDQLASLGRRLASAGVAVTVLPSTDLFLMHRDHDHSVPRGVAPAHTLIDQGVNCSLATNNVLNPFTPFGDCSLIRMANLYANIAQVDSMKTMADCLAMISARPATLMNLSDYGLATGKTADLVVLDSTDPAMAVAELSQPLYGFKSGRPTFTRALPELHEPEGGHC